MILVVLVRDSTALDRVPNLQVEGYSNSAFPGEWPPGLVEII